MADWDRVDHGIPVGNRFDPYLAWVRDAGSDYYFFEGAEPRYPLIIKLNQMTAEEFAGKNWGVNWQEWMRIPDVYRFPASGLRRSRYCTATVTDDFFDRLNTMPALRRAVLRYALGLPVQKHTNAAYAPAGVLNFNPEEGVAVVGIIDDGIAFGNRVFRDRMLGRFEYFWGQDGVVGAVPGMGYGRELAKRSTAVQKGIDDRLVDSCHGGPLMDEKSFYDHAGYYSYRRTGHKPLGRRGGHGTSALDLASGFDENPADRPLIGVQLPVSTTAATGGGDLAPHALDGIRYILARTDDIAAGRRVAPLPVVINLSYSVMGGPHDGTALLEEAIDELVALRENVAPLRVVMPAGNNYLSRCHAEFRLGRTKVPKELDWRIQPDGRTPSFMEIWLPQGVRGPGVAVTITTPTGSVSLPITLNTAWSWRPNGQTLCEAIYFDSAAFGGARNVILIAVAPTATLHPTRQVAPSGIWRVSVRNRSNRPVGLIDAWIQRNDTPYGYPIRGRQSRFSDARYEYRDHDGRHVEVDNASHIKRKGSLSGIATGRSTIVIGGFRRSDWKVARYSSAGTDDQRVRWPDAVAVSDDAPGLPGLLTTGTKSRSTVPMSGTSFAAPQVTRIVADALAAGRPSDRAAVQAGAAASELAAVAPQPPDERQGNGRYVLPPRVNRRSEP